MSDSGRLILGIDLGTTNSLAAVVGKRGAHVLRDRDGEALIPSVVAFPEDAGTPHVGREAKQRALDLPARTVHSIKRLIGRSGDELRDEIAHLPYPVELGDRGLPRIPIDGKAWSPEELSALVLGAVRDRAEQALGQKVEEVVITVPAYFDDAQRQATRHAAELANLKCLRIVNEPTAASLAYGIDGTKDGVVLVYDLGGGTFDVSVLRIEDGVFRVLATAGDTHLGGDDFDREITARILAVLQEKTGVSGIEELGPYVRQAVRRSAEGLKIQLGEVDSASLEIDLGAAGTAALTITRAEFEQAIEPLVARTIACCERALTDAELTVDLIDEVVLVGGSTRVPLVRERLRAFTGRDAHTGSGENVHPDLAVAIGAAIQADVLAGRDRRTLLLDVVPLSLGLETMGGVVSKLILRNATIPTSVTEEFSTQVDNQTGVDLNIYQGEREKVEDCRHLGSFKLSGIPPMPAGLPRVAVTFLVDADGVLRVTAKEQRTGQQASIQIVPSFGLTQDEVRRMMNDSIEHAVEDMTARESIEVRNKAQAMVVGTRKALALAELDPDQTYEIKQATKALEKALARDDTPVADLKRLVDDLSKRTATIADDIVSAAATKALRGDDS
jgi:molecular chaperone DnaK